MPLDLSTRSVAGTSVIACNGRITLGEESAKLRHVVKEALGECKQIVLDLGGRLGFALDAQHPFFVEPFRLDQRDRHITVEARVVRQVDTLLATLAEEAAHLIAAAGKRGGKRRGGRRGRRG